MTAHYKVLVVEDLVLAQRIAVMVLKNIQCDAIAASTGQVAMDIVAKEEFDLILMDLGLPDTDGIALTRKMRSQGGWLTSVPIIALTAHSDQQIKNQANNAGIDGFYVKPMTMKVGKDIIRQYLNLHQMVN
mgnify:CR=1 FL=1